MRKRLNKTIELVNGAAAIARSSQPCRPSRTRAPWRLSILLPAFLLMASSAHSQIVGPNTKKDGEQDKAGSVNVESYLDHLISKAVIAGNAASVIKQADSYRTEASRKLKAGHIDEGARCFGKPVK